MKTITVDLILLKDAFINNSGNLSSILTSLKKYVILGYQINVIEEVIVNPINGLKYQRELELLTTEEELENWINREF
jgi:hypothetical protein